MSFDTTKEVYDNGHCQVVVELCPAQGEHHGSLRPFASITVLAKDLAEGRCYRWYVSYGDESTKQTTGHLWWQKTIAVIGSTQEERLEKAIIDAIKFADSHYEKFLDSVAAGEKVIKDASNVISAIKEVNKLTAGNGE